MKITAINLRASDFAHTELVREIVDGEFPELVEKFEEVIVIAGNDEDAKRGLFEDAIRKYSQGVVPVDLASGIFELRSCPIPPKAYILVNLPSFESFEKWKQRFSVMHECCHLLHYEEIPPVFHELAKIYSLEYLRHFARCQREYLAHSCMIKRAPEYWLRGPAGFKKNTPSFDVEFDKIEENNGKRAALLFCIQNIVHILSMFILYENVPSYLKSKIKKRKKYANGYLDAFSQLLKKNMPTDFPPPETWLTPGDFLSAKLYFDKIRTLLSYTGKSD